MTPQKKNSFPFDPAWIALGLAALVLVGTMVWLITVRSVPRVQAPALAVAGAPAAVAAPDPQLLARLAAAEASLAQLSARPVAETTSPQAVAALVEQRVGAVAPTLEGRFATVEGRLGVIEARSTEAVQAATQRLAEGRAALEQALREGIAAAQARAEAQEQALRAQIERVQQVGEAARQQQAALAAQQAFAEQLGGRLAALEAASQQQQAATEALQRAVAAADAALQQQATAAAEAARRQQAAAAEQAARQREAAEQAQRQMSEQLAGRLAAQEQAARTASEALAQRVASLEQSARQIAEAQRGNERRAAIEAVRRELDAGRPLGPVLPRLGDAPPALSRFAAAAPPTEAALRQSFEEAARNARGTGTPEGALNRLSSVLTVRRGDEVLVGDTNEATVERARRALEAGDLEGALAQLNRLPDATKTAMRPWLNEAEGLLAARAALRQLGQG